MIAIVSDIHSNLEALQAVLDDIREQGAERIYCLGDIIGYGPNPRECIDAVMDFPVVLLGNHDQAALFDPEGFNAGALRAILWTRQQLEEDPDQERAMQRWEFLAERPRRHVENGVIYVHGSVRNPLNEYIFPEDIYNQRKMEKIFALVEQYCFQGHTHVPGIFTERLEYYHPEELSGEYRLDNAKTLINVGSVGQPRDGDWRACYVLFDPKERLVRFRRVPYDVETTIRKIYEVEELDRYLGDRLREGR
ncbi:MAG: metallophosphoesterase family protein [Gemmatales bacterium]|nr:metallophosphoesterase [Gemmatales bacterium]MDW7994245.1 metallophosphoesterase family protein [Gemmatales bacterium]